MALYLFDYFSYCSVSLMGGNHVLLILISSLFYTVPPRVETKVLLEGWMVGWIGGWRQLA